MNLINRIKLQWIYWQTRKHIVNDPVLTHEEKVAVLKLLRRTHESITKKQD